MINVPPMKETDEPLEDAKKYLIDYTEAYRKSPSSGSITSTGQPVLEPIELWRHFEVLSLTIQDLLECVQNLQSRIDELEKN